MSSLYFLFGKCLPIILAFISLISSSSVVPSLIPASFSLIVSSAILISLLHTCWTLVFFSLVAHGSKFFICFYVHSVLTLGKCITTILAARNTIPMLIETKSECCCRIPNCSTTKIWKFDIMIITILPIENSNTRSFSADSWNSFHWTMHIQFRANCFRNKKQTANQE